MRKIFLFTRSELFCRTIHQLFSPHLFQFTQTFRVDFAYQQLGRRPHDLIIIQYDPAYSIETWELVSFCQQSRYEARVLVAIPGWDDLLRIKFFKAGADEVLKFPLPLEELSLRVERLLLYQKERPYQEITFGKLKVIPQRGLVLADQERIPLRKREFQILLCLLRFSNSVVTREMMIDSLWGDDVPMYSTIDSYIRRLRVLIKQDLLKIKTVRGFGYMAIPIAEKSRP